MIGRTTTRSRWQLLAVIGVLLALLAGACSSSSSDSKTDDTGSSGTAATGDLSQNVPVDAPGVTDSEIAYSIVSSGSDPTGACDLPCWTTGVQAYFDYVNTEKGGIYGRKLVADNVVDDEFSKGQEASLQIIADDSSFGVFDYNVVGDGLQVLADENIPVYTWNTNPVLMQGNESVFGDRRPQCLVVGCWDRIVPYQMKLSGRHKLASIGYGIAQSSKDCAQNTAKSVEQFKDQIGADAESVYMNDNLAFGTPNGVAPEISAMKDAGADIMAVCIVNNDTKALMQEAQRQGLDVIPLLPQGYNEAELAAMGGAFDGGYIRNQLRSFQGELNEAQEKYLEYTAKNGGKVSEITYYGWVNGALAYQGLIEAGPEFDQQKVIDGTNTLTDFTAGGIVPPQNWSKGHDAPTPDDQSSGNEYECYSLNKIENGKFVVVGDPATSFNCWSGTNLDWTADQPEHKSFD